MDDILSKYINNPKNKELEVRFKNIDRVVVLSALNAIIKNGMQYVFTAFVDMLDYGPDTKYGIRVFYTNGVVTDRQPFKKKSIAHVKDKAYNIALSEETEDNSISSGQLKPKKVILKYRVSTTIVGYESWRIDIDVIHELDHVAQAVKKAMTNFVKITNIDELMSSLDTERYTYRIEAEHIGYMDKTNIKLSMDDIMDATTLLSMLSEKDTKSSLLFNKKIKRIAEILYPDNETLRIKKAHSPCLKYIVPGVQALTYQEYQKMFPPVDFMISSKIDGYRALILMIDTEAHMIYKRNSVKTLLMKTKGSPGITLLEGEYIEPSNLFVLFDVLHFGKTSLIDKPLESRLEYMDEAMKLITEHVKDIDITAITYAGLSNESEYKKIITGMMDSKLPTDGLILTRKGLPYAKSETYKWKPSHHQTIDFYCKECPESWYNDTVYIKQEGKKLYFLYNGIHKQLMRNIGLLPHDKYSVLFPDTMDYAKIPIQFSIPMTPLSYLYYHDDSDSLNNMIVELSIGSGYVLDNMIDWKFVKVRDDKMCTNGQDYGNAYNTALKTLLNHIEPFPIEYLYMPSIATHKAITPVQKYLSYIKNVAISEYSKYAKHIMDIGMTDGSNLLNYMRKNASSLTVVDVDKANIVRIVERWIDLSNNSLPPTSLKAVVIDINDDVSDNISKMLPIIGSIRYDTVFVFYTIQNFTQTVESIRNFALFCQRLTEKKAKICITVLSGKKIHELGNWKAIEHGQVKYAVERKYRDDQLLNANQQVDITSPSNGRVTQYLVNIDHLTEVFNEQSMNLVTHKSSLDYMNGFQVHDSNKYEQLTDNDKKYIGLYDVIVYERR